MYLKYFTSATIGLFLGISFAYQTNFSSQIFIVSLVLFILNFSIYKFGKRLFSLPKSEMPKFLSILFLLISFGIILGQYSLDKTISQKIVFENYISQNKNFTGTITNISYSENSARLTVKIKDKENSTSYNLKLTTFKIPTYSPGEILSFTGKVSTSTTLLPSAENNLNMSFKTSSLNELNKIDGEITFPKIEVVGKQESFFNSLSRYKNNFVTSLSNVSPTIVASLAAGVTLGDGSLFTKGQLDNFRYSGLSHIIVLSGFNITILIVFFGIIFSSFNLRLKWRVLLSILSIIFFIIFVGGGASIIRAGIMGSTLLLAQVYGKQYVAKQGLFLSAFLMMILSPKIAVSDISFHLSFLATLGILYILPILNDYSFLTNTKNKLIKNILNIFKLTLSVQIMVTPYLMLTFGKISLFGLFANILVVPVVPLIMLLSFLIILFSFFIPSLATLISYLAFIFCKYVFGVSEYFGQFSLSKLETHITLILMIIIYVTLFTLIYFEETRLRIQKQLKSS